VTSTVLTVSSSVRKYGPGYSVQLVTGVRFLGRVVGKALKGAFCSIEFSGDETGGEWSLQSAQVV
jgi:hypothetical protein